MSVRAFLLRVFLFLGTVIVLIGIAELWLRSRLFSDDPAYKEWRDPRLYTRRYKVHGRVVVRDDHDKLAVQWGLLKPALDHPHGLLGWCGGLDSATLLPKGYAAAVMKDAPVLMGAGWTEHGVTTMTGGILGDTPAAPIDLSVAGFSFDQDLLLFEHTREHLRGRKLLLHIDLDDIDHLQRTFVGRPKPWYTIAPYNGELHGVPVITDVRSYLEAAPADPGLYTYHLWRTLVLGDTIMSSSATRAAEGELRELSKKLLFAFLSEARENDIAVSVFLQQHCLGPLADRRRWPLQELCRELGVPCHVLAEEAGAIGLKDQIRMLRIFLEHAASMTATPEHTSLDQLKVLSEMPETERTPLEKAMMTILKDEQWSARVREKAAANGNSFAMMVERDARYMLDHARQ